MTLSTAHVAHLLAALAVIVLVAHIVGGLFVRFHQPRVIGEIVGGLLLGPTVLGNLPGDVSARLFPTAGPVAVGIAVINQLGLLMLMFLAGAQLRVRANSSERRVAIVIAFSGLVVPFLAGALAVRLVDPTRYLGPRGDQLSLMLVFGMATAVAAIPIISRIMMDLGVINTPFARIVLMVATAEDVVLYLALTCVLGLAQTRAADGYGFGTRLPPGEVGVAVLYYLLASLVLFGVCLLWGARWFRWITSRRWNLIERSNPMAFRLTFLFTLVAASVWLGINPIFGSLLAGFCAARGDTAPDRTTEASESFRGEAAESPFEHARSQAAWAALNRVSLEFVIPVYFVTVGLQLNLFHQLDPVFFVLFTTLACVVKGISIWLGALLARSGRRTALRFAVVLNARGTPGVLVASVTFHAGVINSGLFAALVLMSIVTCQIAGSWLDWTFRHGESRRAASAAQRIPLLRAEEII